METTQQTKTLEQTAEPTVPAQAEQESATVVGGEGEATVSTAVECPKTCDDCNIPGSPLVAVALCVAVLAVAAAAVKKVFF